jgi:hypothetical protein
MAGANLLQKSRQNTCQHDAIQGYQAVGENILAVRTGSVNYFDTFSLQARSCSRDPWENIPTTVSNVQDYSTPLSEEGACRSRWLGYALQDRVSASKPIATHDDHRELV